MLLDFTSVVELFCTYPKSDSDVQTLIMIVSQNLVKNYKFGASHDDTILNLFVVCENYYQSLHILIRF